jgi:hypothetical protein
VKIRRLKPVSDTANIPRPLQTIRVQFQKNIDSNRFGCDATTRPVLSKEKHRPFHPTPPNCRIRSLRRPKP